MRKSIIHFFKKIIKFVLKFLSFIFFISSYNYISSFCVQNEKEYIYNNKYEVKSFDVSLNKF